MERVVGKRLAERYRKIREMYENGASIYEIAAKYKYEPSSVEKYLYRMGYDPHAERTPEPVRKPKISSVVIEGKKYLDVTELYG